MDDDPAEVVRLELLLLEPAVRDDPDRLRSLLSADFLEHGASGRVWDRGTVAGATAGSGARVLASDVRARRLGPDAVLLTYRSEGGGRHSLRSSTWVRDAGRWLLLFHQGTPTDSVTPRLPGPN